jgi:hypothetical protein
MKARNRVLWLLCACAAVQASAAYPQAVIAQHFFLSNNTKSDLSCSLWSGNAWLPPFALKGGTGWEMPSPKLEIYVKCAAPADGKPYRIRRGERYSLLRDPSGAVRIYHITA